MFKFQLCWKYTNTKNISSPVFSFCIQTEICVNVYFPHYIITLSHTKYIHSDLDNTKYYIECIISSYENQGKYLYSD